MCLGIPMKVVEISGSEGVVSSGGLRRKANFSLLGGVKTGEYVLIHAGFAIERIKEKEARSTLNALRTILMPGIPKPGIRIGKGGKGAAR